MEKNSEFKIEIYSFNELPKHRGEIIDGINEIAEELVSEQGKRTGKYLRDRINYQHFLADSIYGKLDFGRIFIALDIQSSRIVGYLISLHNHFCKSKRGVNSFEKKFPLDFCEKYMAHDVPYLQNLDVLGDFAFCFQLAVLQDSDSRTKGCGDALYSKFEKYYSFEIRNGQNPADSEDGRSSMDTRDGSDTLILAASVHELQRSAFEFVRNRNRETIVYQSNPDLDYTIYFLDHYSDQSEGTTFWYRLAQIPDYRAFIKKLNYKNIPKAFDTIVPIQLNRSIVNINSIIQHMGGKVLWASFFHDHDLLIRKQISREQYGFFQSALETNREQYAKVAPILRNIISYLARKKSDTDKVKRINDVFSNQAAEIFFIKNGVVDFTSFLNPKVINLDFPQKSKADFLDFLVKQDALKPEKVIHKDDHAKVVDIFLAASKAPSSKRAKTEKKRLIKDLGIGDKDVAIIERFVRYLQHRDQGGDASGRPPEIKKVLKGLYEKTVIPQEEKRAWEEYVYLHQQLYDLDSLVLTNAKDYWWCHAIIPITFFRRKNVMGAMFTFRCRKDFQSGKESQRRVENMAQLIHTSLSRDPLSNLTKLLESDSIKTVIRQSMSSVTARNMAHHMGSHILSNLDTYASLKKERRNLHDDEEFVRKMAKFNSFIRTKTQLLADMNSTSPVSSVAKYLKGEVVFEFNEQYFVKRFVSGTDISKIRVKVVIDIPGKQDVLVQMPNGELGCHALYIIFTNFIRNTAKYEDTQQLNKLILTLRVLSPSNERAKSSKRMANVEDSSRGYEIIIYDNLKRRGRQLNQLVGEINDRISSYASNLGGGLRSAGLGTVEMVAAAAYLRKKDATYPANPAQRKSNLPILRAEPVSDPMVEGGEFGYLGYRIYLKKPRTVMFVNVEYPVGQKRPLWHLDYGVRVLGANSLADTDLRSFSHKFVVTDTRSRREIIETRKRYPLRWLYLKEDQLDANFEQLMFSNDGAKFVTALWQNWVRMFAQRKQYETDSLELMFLNNKSHEVNSQIFLSNKQYLVFDHHGTHFNSVIPHESLIYYESYGSNSKADQMIKDIISTLDEAKRIKNRCELIECALTMALILDERIQAQLDRMSKEEENFFQKWKLQNVYIPDPNKEGIVLQQKNALALVEKWIENQLKKPIDFVVLHLGLLESWKGSNPDVIAKWIQQTIIDVNPRPEIVIISGRGRPHRLSPRFCFQPASLISEQMVGDKASKFNLTKVLFSSRTRPPV